MDIDRRRVGGERRRERRVPLVAAVLGRAGGSRELAQVANIGRSGMLLVRVPDGRAWARTEGRGGVALSFELPGGGGELIEVSAEVVFDRPLGRFRATGVRFSEFHRTSDARRIDAYVAATAGGAVA